GYKGCSARARTSYVATNLATDAALTIFELASLRVFSQFRGLVRLAGFEPATRCLEGTLVPSPESARHGLTWRLAAPILAGRGLASLSICHRWLPSWLPAIRQTSTRVRRGAGRVGWCLSFAGQLRHLGNQARDYPRPKAATPGRDRPTSSAAAP